MRVVDYIARFVHGELHVDTVFMVSGGGMMFLSDGLACYPRLKVVCNHHEQASAMAAVGYAKQKNDFGVAMVTTGCGGTCTGAMRSARTLCTGNIFRRSFIRIRKALCFPAAP